MSISTFMRTTAFATVAAGALMVLAPSLASANPRPLLPAAAVEQTDVYQVNSRHRHHARSHHGRRHHGHHRRHH